MKTIRIIALTVLIVGGGVDMEAEGYGAYLNQVEGVK
jgi:hypothetical protein